MNIPEEFGKYLLLKKLTEDPLGETFRAGKAGRQGMEQVVLLRVFNGRGMDGEKLWQKVEGRAAVQQALRSPNIGSGVDLGKVRSYPYTAYDYISGTSLAALLAQAAKQFSPIPTDHALLIAERIALALAAAYETRAQDERIQHGFVVPHLVMISNEGETRLLGFEVAPGLRALAADGWSDAELRPYLAPEVFEGAAIGKSDDVYSLGAILFELLTGERLPAAPAGGYGALIDGAMLSNEGTPLPPAIVGLLKKSLVPRDQRIADVVTWHKTLSKLMIDGQFSPTTFNLAFFMHNLFRDEIERESQEMQAEKKLELTHRPAAPATVPVPVAAPVVDMREKPGVRQTTLAGAQVVGEASSKKGLFIGIAAAALVAVGIGAYFVLGRSSDAPQSIEAPVPAAAATTQQASMPVQPAGPTQEELQAQIQAMLDTRSQEMEAKLKLQYDDRLKQLQQQLEDTKKRESQVRVQEQRPAPAPIQTQEPAPATVETKAAVKPPEPVPAPVTGTAASVPAPQPSSPATGATAENDKVAASDPEPAPAVQAPAPQPQAPAPRQIQYGDLVPLGTPGVTAPKLSSRLDPRYPAAAERMNKSAEVVIKVLVDERGRVVDAQRSGPKAGLGFDEAALDAARRASFNPATTKDGTRVKMWATLRVSFKPH